MCLQGQIKWWSFALLRYSVNIKAWMLMLWNKKNRRMTISSLGSCVFSFIRRKWKVFPKADFFQFSYQCSNITEMRVSCQRHVFKCCDNWSIFKCMIWNMAGSVLKWAVTLSVSDIVALHLQGSPLALAGLLQIRMQSPCDEHWWKRYWISWP